MHILKRKCRIGSSNFFQSVSGVTCNQVNGRTHNTEETRATPPPPPTEDTSPPPPPPPLQHITGLRRVTVHAAGWVQLQAGRSTVRFWLDFLSELARVMKAHYNSIAPKPRRLLAFQFILYCRLLCYCIEFLNRFLFKPIKSCTHVCAREHTHTHTHTHTRARAQGMIPCLRTFDNPVSRSSSAVVAEGTLFSAPEKKKEWNCFQHKDRSKQTKTPTAV